MVILEITTAPTASVNIQDPYPSEGEFAERIPPNSTRIFTLLDSQFDRVQGQLDNLVTAGLITYTALDGPASQVSNDSDAVGTNLTDALNNLLYGYAAGSRVLHVDGARTLSYVPDGTPQRPYLKIQDAVDSITDESYNKKYIVRVAPSTYDENVVLKRHVYLSGGGFGANYSVIINPSAGGIALSIPYRESYIHGIGAITDSAVPTDAGIKIFDDGGGLGNHETFLMNFLARSTDAGHALWVDTNPFGEAAIGIEAAIDGGPNGLAAYLDGGGFIFFVGGMGSQKNGFKLVNGAFLMAGAEAGINASETDPTAWCIDAENSFVVLLGTMLSGYNGIDAKIGTTLWLNKACNLGGFSGIPIRTAVGSLTILGNVGISGGGTAMGGWQISGNIAIAQDSTQGFGTTGTGGPDQRPTTTSSVVPIGFKWFATDLSLGVQPGVWLTWNGGAWVDTAGGVHP